MTRALIARIPRNVAVILATLAALGLARLMTYTDWAAANATLAALLFAWIVIDALCLSTIAKAKDRKPPVFAMLGAAALGAFIVLVGASSAVRERIFTMPALLAALGGTVLLWLVLAATRVAKSRRAGATWDAALAEVAPGPFVQFYLTELRMMHLALFVWRRPPDVPEGAQGFAYHRYLTPMLATLIGLQVIELGVVHLLLVLWNPTVAWVIFALTFAGLLWFIALTKSLRLMPLLLTETTLRVRMGTLIDLTIDRDAIAAIGETFDADTLKDKRTLDATILSAPNTTLRLSRPVPMKRLFGKPLMVDRIALRLDDPAAFRAAFD